MARRSNRPRRAVNSKKIRTLRVFGWRYSTSREAWVHRAFRGRVGPVFIDPEYHQHPGVTDAVASDAIMVRAIIPRRTPEAVVPEAERTPLPRRPISVPRDLTQVRVSLGESEEPRVVRVDGRPPRRGIDPRVLSTTDDVVVPIKSARAIG